MGKDDRLQKSMAVMAAIKKGMASVGQLKDQCNEAIRKGPDLNGIAERMRIPVAGVHGRNYMKLVRDDVRDSLTETALAKGKGRLLPGFGDNLDEEQKMIANGTYMEKEQQAQLLLAAGESARRLALGNGEGAGGDDQSPSGSGDDSGSDSESESESASRKRKRKKSSKGSKKSKKSKKETKGKERRDEEEDEEDERISKLRAYAAKHDAEETAAFLTGAKLGVDNPELGIHFLVEALFDEEKPLAPQVKTYKPFFAKCCGGDAKLQLALLCAVELYITETATAQFKQLPSILKELYEGDSVEEEVLLKWAADPKAAKKFGVDAKTGEAVRKQAKPFIDWLQQEEEESEEDDDEEDEE
mmetsp:Transcript_3058/g.7016  ORF Transcript_3058/g.7016 Transcript_3058/m.7016 type:complete len:358 (-) Transcript_3058:326-1399(-)